MSRKKKHVETIHVLSSLEATRIKMPKYNGFSCRGGLHKSKKDYTRKPKYPHRFEE